MRRHASGTPSSSPGTSGAPRRIAFHYLRDAAEADEAVQDAFVKAYTHLASFREELPFEVWFTRILINGCLDRIKARTRRERWMVPMPDELGAGAARLCRADAPSARSVAGGAAAREGAPAAAGRGARAAARAAALGVHVESLRRLHVARSERDHGVERVDGPRASVPGDSQAADAARHGCRTPGTCWGETPCHCLTDSAPIGHLDDDARSSTICGRAATRRARPAPRRPAPHCRARFAAFDGWLDEVRTTPAPRRTRRFPAERLAAQQAQILRRLEALERPARVIAFPKFARARRPARVARRRWVAAAAAAGLIVGIGLGPDRSTSADVLSAAGRRAPGRSQRRAASTGRRTIAVDRQPPVTPTSRRTNDAHCSRSTPSPSAACQHPRALDDDRRRAGATTTQIVVPPKPLIFRKGLDMKEAVAGELAAAYHSALVDEVRADDYQFTHGPPHDPSRAGVRLLLRRRSRGRLRLPGAPALSRPQRLPDRRDHPQPARQRPAARERHPLPHRSGRDAATRSAPTTS